MRSSKQKQYNTSFRIFRLAEGLNSSVEIDDGVAGPWTLLARILLVRLPEAAPESVDEVRVVIELEFEKCSSSLISERASTAHSVEAISLEVKANSP